MRAATLRYTGEGGWDEGFPALDSETTLLVVFGAPELGVDGGPLTDLLEAFPASSAIGCSTAGEFIGDELLDSSLVVAVMQFEEAEVRLAPVQPVASSADSHAAGRAIAEALSGPDLKGVFVLSDGLAVNGSELVAGLRVHLPSGAVVTGGLAGDGERFGETWVLDRGRPRSGVVSAVGLYGESLCIGHGSKGGWDIFGLERTITRARGNILYELDGHPALSLYKDYLGELAGDLPASGLRFPLALNAGRSREDPVVRTILAVREEDQALVFAGDMPEGRRAQLMRANVERLIDGAADAASAASVPDWPGGPTVALGISCVGRRLVLGERAEEEIEASLS